MITAFFYTILEYLVVNLTQLLPASTTLSPNITNGLNSFATYFNYLNSFVPMDTLVTILGLGLTFELGVLTFKLINFAINKIRGSG